MLSEDGGRTWGAPMRAPVTAPHGPIRLRSGALLYLGKRYVEGWSEMENGPIVAAYSSDAGRTWIERGSVPLHPKTRGANYHEPHVVELPSGQLLGLIRVENASDAPLKNAGLLSFSMMQTESRNGGRTWSVPRPLNYHGSPPHLLRHSSGALLLTYGYRQPPLRPARGDQPQ